MLEVLDLFFRYPGGFRVEVERLSLLPGEVTALIGPNGAGKTTFLRLLAGLLEPLRGRIRFRERPLREVLRAGEIALFLDSYPPRTSLSPVTWMRLVAAARGRRASREEARKWFARHGLAGVAGKRFSSMSSGERRRSMLAVVSWGDPSVVLLDEPLATLDPGAVMEWRQRILEQAHREKVVVVSSHALLDLERIATRFVFMRGGRVLRVLGREELRERRTVRVQVAAACSAVEAALDESWIVSLEEQAEGTVAVLDESRAPAFSRLVSMLAERGLEVTGGGPGGLGLEDAFREVTEGEEQQEEGEG